MTPETQAAAARAFAELSSLTPGEFQLRLKSVQDDPFVQTLEEISAFIEEIFDPMSLYFHLTHSHEHADGRDISWWYTDIMESIAANDHQYLLAA